MEEKQEIKQRRNKKVKQKGNGQGTLYFSETLNKWVGQYVDPSRTKKNTYSKKK